MKIPKDLQPLIDDGIVDAVVRSLKSGKEASVYVVRSGTQVLCAKVYKNMAQRSFQARVQYQEGRKVRGSRQARAIGKASLWPQAAGGVEEHRADVLISWRMPVCRSRAVLPRVLLMDLVTDADGHSAPRLGEVELSPEEALSFHQRLMKDVQRMLCQRA